MTTTPSQPSSIEAMKQALEALGTCEVAWAGTRFKSKYFDETKVKDSLASLRQAIALEESLVAEAEKQEPVAWMHPTNNQCISHLRTTYTNAIPLYTSPPQRQWVGLKPHEQAELVDEIDWYNFPVDLVRATEAKLKEKNT